MAHLPPVGWADVATKRDLDALEERINLRFEKVDGRFETIDGRFSALEERFDLQFTSFEEIFTARLEPVEERVVGRIHAEIGAQSRTMIFAMMSLIFTAVLLTYTAARFS